MSKERYALQQVYEKKPKWAKRYGQTPKDLSMLIMQFLTILRMAKKD